MKKLLFFIICSLMVFGAAAQVKFGIKGGLSTVDVQPEQLLITNVNDAEAFGLAVAEANYGVHFGLFTQFKIGKFFLQPEALFNSNSVDFTVNDFSGNSTWDNIRNEKYQYLDLPILAGLKFGALRLQGGPVGHVFLNSKSELFEVDGYGQKFDEMTWGWQAGVGLDLWKIMLDFRYEGNFNKYGDHITFFGQPYNFDQSPGRFVASLGISF